MTITAPPRPSATDRLRQTFESGRTRPLAWRRQQLERLLDLLRDGEAELLAALRADLGKPEIEAYTTDVGFTALEVKEYLRHLDRWASPERIRVPMQLQPAKAWLHREPLGLTLVIAPWNYPVQLLLVPMAAAIAAGNPVVGKPSELAPATAAAIARLVPRYLDPDAVAIVEGGVEETSALLEERWDHIFYTGNGRVGRIVMTAAAKHLTPVTLELGGKSPTIVDRTADIDVAARRVAWGKFVNAGQTCVAPDHVFVHAAVHDQFVSRVAAAVHDFYGADPHASADYARIVNDRHFARLSGLLDGGGYDDVVIGGSRDPGDRYFAPTVLRGVSDSAPVMGEEIFGPLLPVIKVADVDEAIGRINAGGKPLALYAFGSKDVTDRIVDRTSSGGVAVNCTLLQLSMSSLPFGGVGESGMGAYHGRRSFDTFSHVKPVYARAVSPDPSVAYPPYSRLKRFVLRRMFG